MQIDDFEPLTNFLRTQLTSADMKNVTNFLQAMCDSDSVDTASDRRRRMVGDSQIYFGQRRHVAPTASQLQARATMFPDGSRLYGHR